jgi:glycosyltransferase involved in cell wall biosynthesis
MSVRIAFDATFAVGKHRGMGKFTNFFLKGLASKNNVAALLPSGIKEKSTIGSTVKFGFSFYPLWEQLSLPLYCKKEKVDYLVCPYNTAPVFLSKKIKLILIVHDLIFLDQENKKNKESRYQKFGRRYRKLIVPSAIKKAYSIVTVSEYSKSVIQKEFNIPAEKIQVISNTINAEWFDKGLDVEERDNYIFTLAGEAPSKNLMNVIKAFAWLKSDSTFEKYSLKIAGIKKEAHKYFYELADSLKIKSSIKLVEYCSDEEIRALYKKAKLFILGSKQEGFGIPLLEAFATGTPVVCSNATSMPEIAGDAALFFDPENPEEMAEKISIVIKNKDIWKMLQSNGSTQSKKYSPEKVKEKINSYWNTMLNL